jgi:outer membrane protein OmpA-like peptidoglycan-associated protein
MKKFLLFMLISFGISFTSRAQDFLGYINSNYAGVTGTDLQPASVVDSRYKVDVALFGLSAGFYNNYVGIKKDAFKHSGGLFNGTYPAFEDTAFAEHYLTHRNSPQAKSLYLASQFYLPSFLVTINSKNAIALKWKIRTLMNVDGVTNELAALISSKLDYPSLFALKLHNENLSIQTMSWAEYGLTYGHVFKDEGQHFFKAGATVKLIQGLQAGYMKINDLHYEFTTDTTVSIFQTEVSYGHSNNFDFNQNNIRYKFISSPSLGFDLGVVYEWRPDFEKYKYDMDGETNLSRKDKNKYKLRLGLSLVDVGRVKFTKGEHSQDFIANIKLWDISNVDPANIENFDDTIRKKFVTIPGPSTFKMNLPTTLSAQIDYNIYKDFYLNFTPYFVFQFKKHATRVHDISTYSLTPRWDHKWFGAFIPVSYDAMRNTKIGLGLRLGPVIIGTNNIAPFVGTKDLYGADIYFMFKVPIMYKYPKDRDKDKISDKKDKCKDVAGVWEFMGCPDKDGDHIQDKDDLCPDLAGSIDLKGCPDKDGDKIADKDDACPDDSGLVEFNGCPDTDGDKIIDKEDECPDAAGLIQFKGCPDKDNDSIPDRADRCPDKAGPASNDGCPETKLSLIDLQGNKLHTIAMSKDQSFAFSNLPSDELVIFKLEGEGSDTINEVKVVVNGIPKRATRNDDDKYFRFIVLTTDKNKLDQEDAFDVAVRLNQQEKALIKKAFENLEFDLAKDVITEGSYSSLNDLAGLMQKKPNWRLKISGHTDNKGTPVANLKLSQKRATAVRDYLVSKGIDKSRFKVEWFGSKKPIADNKTEEGRQKNRRVEMLLVE